ncbi:MAG TPA: hypothetical protein VF996_03030 [Candidatus Saccharimonadales bacterium]
MAVISPTVTALNLHQYREQIERISKFADRIHIDLMDGIFAPTRSPGFKHTWWPKEILEQVDIHIMYENPLLAVEYLVGLRPQLIILHAEANHQEVSEALALIDAHRPIKRGLAILPETKPKDVAGWLKKCDHCLVFSGDLGHFGGRADMKQTEKISELLDINPNLEIGWDGGINDKNVTELIKAGVDVLNAGGFIQKSTNPANAYAILQQIASVHK